MTIWHDTRVKKPNPKYSDIYPVTILYCNMVMSGYATWIPDPGYESGQWTNITATNGNKWSDTVILYWCDIPKFNGKIEVK